MIPPGFAQQAVDAAADFDEAKARVDAVMEQLPLDLEPTIAMEKGKASVWQCAWCGSIVYTTRGVKPPAPCSVCTPEDPPAGAVGWWRQDLPVGPFREKT